MSDNEKGFRRYTPHLIGIVVCLVIIIILCIVAFVVVGKPLIAGFAVIPLIVAIIISIDMFVE